MKFQELAKLIESSQDDSRMLTKGEEVYFYTTGSDVVSMFRVFEDDITEDGDEIYVDSNRFIHRSDGPAMVRKSGHIPYSISYFVHGKRHRIDGPAKYSPNGSDQDNYFINGKKYTKEEFDMLVGAVVRENIDDISNLSDMF